MPCASPISIERALRGELRLPEVMAKRFARKGRIKAFAIEPEVLINNQWSNRFTVIEVTGLDRPGLLYELTTTISKLSLNIASAHVATFGERVVDVFYVTDLTGAQITAPMRQAAIKRALLPLFAEEERKPEGELAFVCHLPFRGHLASLGLRNRHSHTIVNHNPRRLLPARNAHCASATLSGYLTAH